MHSSTQVETMERLTTDCRKAVQIVISRQDLPSLQQMFHAYKEKKVYVGRYWGGQGMAVCALNELLFQNTFA